MSQRKSEFLSPLELERYSRHLLLPGVGADGQLRLKNAKVLCVGAGGLGSPCLLYLAAAGIGTIGIIDGDRVDSSNLQRQILFSTDSVGSLKVEEAKKKLLELNPLISIHTYPYALDETNVFSTFAEYDCIVDGTDNFFTKYLVNDACVHLGKANIQASIFQFEGQCSVYLPGGPCYRCLYPNPPPLKFSPNCAENGVFGVLPGMMGTLQATEVIKYFLQRGELLTGRLILFDALAMTFREIKLERNPECALCIKKQPFETLLRESDDRSLQTSAENEITVQELEAIIRTGIDFLLVDVRTQEEHDLDNLGGKLIPLDSFSTNISFLNKAKNTSVKIIVHCQSGARSLQALRILKEAGFTNVLNLTGGMIEWRKTAGQAGVRN